MPVSGLSLALVTLRNAVSADGAVDVLSSVALAQPSPSCHNLLLVCVLGASAVDQVRDTTCVRALKKELLS